MHCADFVMEMAQMGVLGVHLHGGYVAWEACVDGKIQEDNPSAWYSGGNT
jgi:hypothetical protein